MNWQSAQRVSQSRLANNSPILVSCPVQTALATRKVLPLESLTAINSASTNSKYKRGPANNPWTSSDMIHCRNQPSFTTIALHLHQGLDQLEGFLTSPNRRTVCASVSTEYTRAPTATVTTEYAGTVTPGTVATITRAQGSIVRTTIVAGV